MKIKIKASELLKRLKEIAPICGGRTTQAALTCVKMEVGNDGVKLSATNLDHYMTCAFKDGEVLTAGTVLVACKMFTQVLSSFGEVTIEAEGTTLHFTEGKNKAKLQTLPLKEVVEDPKIGPSEVILSGNGSAMADDLGWLIKASSSDASRHILQGAMIFPAQSLAFSSDGKRCHSLAIEAKGNNPVNIHAESLRFILPVMRGCESVTVTSDGHWIIFTAGEWCLVSKAIEGMMPIAAVTRVMPDFDRKITGSKLEILEALKACGPMVAASFRESVTLSSEPMGIVIAATHENQSIERYVSGGGIDFAVELSLSFLSDALAGSGEAVTFEVNDDASPIVMKSEKRKAVLMPMRGGA